MSQKLTGQTISDFSVHLISEQMPNDRSMKLTENNNNNRDEVKRNEEEQKNGNTERSDWESWMRSQPLSVLKLDRTERLVLRIGGEPEFSLSLFFNAQYSSAFYEYPTSFPKKKKKFFFLRIL